MAKKLLSCLLCGTLLFTALLSFPPAALAAEGEADSSIAENLPPASLPEEAGESGSAAPGPAGSEADADLRAAPESDPAVPEEEETPPALDPSAPLPAEPASQLEEPAASLPADEPEPEAAPAAGDTTPPQIHAVRVLGPVVKKPGVVTLEIDYTEDDTGLNVLNVTLARKNEDGTVDFNAFLYGAYGLNLTSVMQTWPPLYGTGTIRIPIPVPNNTPNGEWVVYSVRTEDQAGNKASWNSQFSNHIALFPENAGLNLEPDTYYFFFEGGGINWEGPASKAPTCGIEDEFDIEFQLSLTNPALISRIEAMAEGKTARILIDGNGILPAAVLEAIRGKNKTLVLYHPEGYEWVINGLDITKAAKDINLLLALGQVKGSGYGVADENVVALAFAPNGELPGKAHIRFKSDYLYNQRQLKGTLYLYYEIESGDSVETIGAIMRDAGATGEEMGVLPGELVPISGNFDLAFDGSDKWCYLDVYHNSKYLISASPLATKISFASTNAIRSAAAGKTLKASQILPAASAKKAKWSSSNTAIATVNAKTGLVTTLAPGKVKITAKIGGKKLSYILYVYSPQQSYAVKLKPNSSKAGKVSATAVTALGGQSVTLKAAPKKGYAFVGWYCGSTLLSTKAKYKYKVIASLTLTAKFQKTTP